MCTIIHGFKEILGKNCHDYPKNLYIYKTNLVKDSIYSNFVENSLHDNELDDKIEEDIKNKYYDLIIYGLQKKYINLIYYDIVNQIYKPNEVIFICENDCDYIKFLNIGHTIFVNE